MYSKKTQRGAVPHRLFVCFTPLVRAAPSQSQAEKLTSVVGFLEAINSYAQDAEATGRPKQALEALMRELRESIPKENPMKKEVLSMVLALPLLAKGKKAVNRSGESDDDSPARRKPPSHRRTRSPTQPRRRCDHCKALGHDEAACWTKHASLAPQGWVPRGPRS